MRNANVLAVDDDPAITRLVRSRLKTVGIQCDTASSAEEALQLMQQNLYFVVIADIHMPGMSGVQMISALKEISPLVQVIMLTSDATVERVIAYADRGAVEFFAKGGEPSQLVVTVRFALSRCERWIEWIGHLLTPSASAGEVS